MKEHDPVRITAIRRGGTIYIAEYTTGKSAKETADDKVKRLILNEPITLEKSAS